MTNIVAVRREDTARAREKRFSVQTIPWLRAVTAVYVYQYVACFLWGEFESHSRCFVKLIQEQIKTEYKYN